MRFLLLILLMAVAIGGMAQDKDNVLKRKRIELLKEEHWFEGSILTADEKELKGLVKFNDQEGFVSFNDGAEQRIFRARSLQGFEFFDEDKDNQRVFYVFDYANSSEEKSKPTIFEVLKQYETFAVLLRVESVEADQVRRLNYATNGNPDQGTALVLQQVRAVCFMDSHGDIREYISNLHREKVTRDVFGSDKRVKKTYTDEELITEYVDLPLFVKMKSYAKESNLRFNVIEDLVKIFDYYDTLIK